MDRVRRLHDEVDREVDELVRRLPVSLRCSSGCAECCPNDLTILGVEAEWIVHWVGVELVGHEQCRCGCPFLDHRRHCRIYPVRPYVCRTQGLPLRWYQEDDAGQVAEPRCVCPCNAELVHLPALDSSQLWLLGPYEAQLVELDIAHGGLESKRIDAWSLFGRLAEAWSPVGSVVRVAGRSSERASCFQRLAIDSPAVPGLGQQADDQLDADRFLD
ncbi:YkgJ family cysteine cluster protein [Myxococcota bacterium]